MKCRRHRSHLPLMADVVFVIEAVASLSAFAISFFVSFCSRVYSVRPFSNSTTKSPYSLKCCSISCCEYLPNIREFCRI